MSIASSRVETRIVVNADTGKAVKGLESVKRNVRGVSKAVRSAVKDTTGLKAATQDYNKTAAQGGKDTKEVMEGIRDMLGNQLGPEVSMIATGFGGIEKIARTIPGPIGLIAAAVATITVGVGFMAVKARQAENALKQAFGEDRLSEVKAISDDLGISAESMISVQEAADKAEMSSTYLHETLRDVVGAAKATGKDGSEAVAKFAQVITTAILPARRLLNELNNIGKEARTISGLRSAAAGTGLEGGVDRFLGEAKKQKALLEPEKKRLEKQLAGLVKTERLMQRKGTELELAYARQSIRQVEKQLAPIDKQLANIEKRTANVKTLLEADQKATEGNAAAEWARAKKEVAELNAKTRAAADKALASQAAAIASKRRAAARRAAARRKAQLAQEEKDRKAEFQELQGFRQSAIDVATVGIDAMPDHQFKLKAELKIKRELMQLDKDRLSIIEDGVAVEERIRARELQSQQKVLTLRKEAADSAKDAKFAIASAAAQGAASLIESERASAGIMALMSAAEAWRNIGSGNIPGAIASGVAAAQYALVAGTGRPTLPGTGGGASPDRPTFTGARPTASTGAEPSGGGVVNVTFGKGFIIGSPQTVGQAINGAVQSLSGTGYGQKAGV